MTAVTKAWAGQFMAIFDSQLQRCMKTTGVPLSTFIGTEGHLSQCEKP